MALAISTTACLTGEIGTNEAAGGDDLSSADGGAGAGTSSGGSGATGGSGGSGTGVGGGAGGGPECNGPEDCPGVDSACAYRLCTDGSCDFVNAASGTACSEGDGQLCDGGGSCVECLSQSDCAAGICQNDQCVPASCSDGVQNGDESAMDCGGSCAPCGNGMGCGGPDDCTSSYCDGGTCAPCGSDGDCGSTQYCASGSCAAKKTPGALCTSANQCASGYCPAADGVCCNSACGGTCRACVAGKTGGSNGVCGDVSVGLDPESECPDQGAGSCGSNGMGCDGDGACTLYASGTTCGAASCSGGQETSASACNGSGTCVSGGTSSCSPYVCGGNSCKNSCSSGGDCISGYECQSGQCVQPGCGGAGPTTTPLDSQEQQLLVLINNHRANNGLGALTACTSLNRSAQGHSEDMRDSDYFSHTGLNNSTMVTRSCDACYSLACPLQTAMAENIAAGNSTASATFNQWVNSPGHNANMLGSNYTVIGIGRATGGGTYGVYWTNVFGGASEASCN